MLHGIKINGIDLLERFGLVLLADLKVGEAVPRENYITVPGSSGALDFSMSPGGAMTYEQRAISGRLFKRCYDIELERIRRALAQDYHGQRVSVILPSSPGLYYQGRIRFGELGEYGSGIIPFSMIADPWAYALADSVKIVSVAAPQEVYLCNAGQQVTPRISTVSPVDVTFGNTTQRLPAGDNQTINGLSLSHGQNTITIAPAQTGDPVKVVIKWRERFL